MSHAEYTVRLDAFEGPLDLLLFLIRRAEVEINDIPIAEITQQYLSYIEQLTLESAGEGEASPRGLDIERAGEFLVMAATLMELKSRELAPPATPAARHEGGAPDAEPTSDSDRGDRGNGRPLDPRAELVQQLLEYKRFRDASQRLDDHRRGWEARFPGGGGGRALNPSPSASEASFEEGEGAPVEIEDLELIDLVQAFARIMESVDFTRVGEHRVVMDDTPVELHAEDILDRLRRNLADAASTSPSSRAHGLAPGEMPFIEIFRGRSRSEMIGLFLAVLELCKQQRLAVRQDAGDGEGRRIVVCLAEDAGADSGGASPRIDSPTQGESDASVATA